MKNRCEVERVLESHEPEVSPLQEECSTPKRNQPTSSHTIGELSRDKALPALVFAGAVALAIFLVAPTIRAQHTAPPTSSTVDERLSAIAAGQAEIVKHLQILEAELASIRARMESLTSSPAPKPENAHPATVTLKGIPTLGAPTAPVAMVVYSDFQCPFCASFSRDTLPQLRATYIETGKLLFAFRHFPLEELHPDSFEVAKTSSCAGEQGRFWPMHDLLFDGPGRETSAQLRSLAVKLQLSMTEFERCFGTSGAVRVRQDISDGVAQNISSTPTFLYGYLEDGSVLRVTGRIVGAQALDRFTEVMQELLAQKR